MAVHTDNTPKAIQSSQGSLHPKLNQAVLKHCSTPWLKPIADHNRKAFEVFCRWAEDWPGKIRLDTGCGVGESTANLARLHPEDLIIGLDKSVHRLDTHSRTVFDKKAENYHLLRVDLEDFWRLLAADPRPIAAQYFFYPNPWPKPDQFMRRWPAHPVFPSLAAVSGDIEVRSNWSVYVEEFCAAYRIATGRHMTCELFTPQEFLTPFERKFALSGQALYRAAWSAC